MNLKDVLSNSQEATERWHAALEKQWQDQVLEDDSDIDIDLLAACAEGRLSAEEESHAYKMIAASPAALETFLVMRQGFNQSIDTVAQLTISPADSTPLPIGKSANEQPVSLPHRISRWQTAPLLTVAASLLFAAVSGGLAFTQRMSGQGLRTEIASLQQQLTQATDSLKDQTQFRLNQSLLAEKELGLTLAAERKPVFMAGRVSPAMLITSIRSQAVARGPEAESPISMAFRKDVTQRLGGTIKQLSPQAADRASVLQQTEIAMQQILSEDLAGCHQTLDDLKSRFPNEPEVSNLEAVLLLADAENETADDAKAMFSEAETILKNLTVKYPDYGTAWLNLALLVEERAGLEEARQFWDGYLAAEQNADLRSVIETHLNQ